MKEYLKAQNKINESVIENVFSSDELHRFSISDSRWAENRKKFLVKSSEFSFISHNSLLKLNDIRTVSINRILYQQSRRIPPNSDTYKQIETLTLQKYSQLSTAAINKIFKPSSHSDLI